MRTEKSVGILCLILAALLCGCAQREAIQTPESLSTTTPTPESAPPPAPVSIVDAWGFPRVVPDSASVHTLSMGKGGFWVEAVSQGLWENEFCRDLTLSFYRAEDEEEPFQVIETEVAVWPNYFEICAEDIDFDGYLDLYYKYSEGTHNRYYVYYVWDPEMERFVEDPYGLSEFENPAFDQEAKAVVTWYRTSIWGGHFTYYRYLNGELLPVRRCSYPYIYEGADLVSKKLWVEDYENGAWKTVFQIERFGEEEFTDEENDAFTRWYDLDYHG